MGDEREGREDAGKLFFFGRVVEVSDHKLTGVGTSPCSKMRSRFRVGSGIGIAQSNTRVYECSGLASSFTAVFTQT